MTCNHDIDKKKPGLSGGSRIACKVVSLCERGQSELGGPRACRVKADVREWGGERGWEKART